MDHHPRHGPGSGYRQTPVEMGDETISGTKREAEKRLAEFQHNLDTVGFVNPVKGSLSDYLSSWIQDYA